MKKFSNQLQQQAMIQKNFQAIEQLLASVFEPLGIAYQIRTLKVHQEAIDDNTPIDFNTCTVCA